MFEDLKLYVGDLYFIIVLLAWETMSAFQIDKSCGKSSGVLRNLLKFIPSCINLIKWIMDEAYGNNDLSWRCKGVVKILQVLGELALSFNIGSIDILKVELWHIYMTLCIYIYIFWSNYFNIQKSH